MKKLSLALLVSASLISVNAFAHRGFVGAKVVPNVAENTCQTCHVGTGGGSPWNTFGGALMDDQITYYDGGQPNWASFCDEDFDGDGFTNGEELGDPNCTFPAMAAGVWESNPADSNSVPSNNANNGTNNGTTAGNNGTTAAGNNGTTAAGNNGTTAAGNNGTTAAGNNGTTNGNPGTNNNTGATNNTTTGATEDEGCSSTGSNPGRFSLFFVLGLFFLGRKRRQSKK